MYRVGKEVHERKSGKKNTKIGARHLKDTSKPVQMDENGTQSNIRNASSKAVQDQLERNTGFALFKQQTKAMFMKKVQVTVRSWNFIILQVRGHIYLVLLSILDLGRLFFIDVLFLVSAQQLLAGLRPVTR